MNSKKPEETRVLVVGASGYIGSHCVKQLLEKGYQVRGTVRSFHNKSKYDFLFDLVPEKQKNFELFDAELLKKEIWRPLVQGCDYVIHIAFPYLAELIDDQKELSKVMVEGVLNVFKAALEEGVKKFIFTSTFATIEIGNEEHPITSDCWAKADKCNAYFMSKLIAEKGVWNYWEDHKDKIDLTVINPGHIFGPQLVKGAGGDNEEIMASFMTNQWSSIPKVCWAVVDVRDVVDSFIKSMTNPISNGKRYILVAESMWVSEIFDYLKREFETYGYEFPESEVGKLMMNILSFWDSKIKSQLSESTQMLYVDNSPSIKELGMEYRRAEDFLIETVYNLIKLGVVPDRIHNIDKDKEFYDKKVHFNN